jgi:DNA-binding CsgD family transcriptional regulator
MRHGDPTATLIGSIYDITACPEQWPGVLEQIADHLGAFTALLGPREISTFRPLDLWTARMDIERVPSFFDYSMVSPWSEAAKKYPLGVIATTEQGLPTDQLMRTSFYHEVVCPLEVHHGMGGTLQVSPDLIAHVSFYRSNRYGPFGPEDVESCQQLTGHLARALGLQYLIGGLETRVRAFDRLLDQLPLGVLLVDAQARVCFRNRAAGEVINAQDGLGVTRGVLRCASSAETSKLTSLIRKAASSLEVDGEPGGSLRVSRPSLKRPFSILVLPLAAFCSPIGYRRAQVAVVVNDPEQRTPSHLELLRDLYGLTPSEAAVAKILMRGASLRQAADELRVRLSTARTHLQHIFDKTGVRRQSELVRLLLTGPAALTLD